MRLRSIVGSPSVRDSGIDCGHGGSVQTCGGTRAVDVDSVRRVSEERRTEGNRTVDRVQRVQACHLPRTKILTVPGQVRGNSKMGLCERTGVVSRESYGPVPISIPGRWSDPKLAGNGGAEIGAVRGSCDRDGGCRENFQWLCGRSAVFFPHRWRHRNLQTRP